MRRIDLLKDNSISRKCLLLIAMLFAFAHFSTALAATVYYKIINNSGKVVIVFSNNSTTVGVHATVQSPFATNYRFYKTMEAALLDATNNGGAAAVTDETVKVAAGATVADKDTLYVRYDYNPNHGIKDNTTAKNPVCIDGSKEYNMMIKDGHKNHLNVENYVVYHGLNREVSMVAYVPENLHRANFLWKFVGTVAPGYSTPDPYDIKIVNSKGEDMGSNYVMTGMLNKKTFTNNEISSGANSTKNFTAEYRADDPTTTTIQRFFLTRHNTNSTLQIAGASTSFIYQANAGGGSHFGQWFYLSYYGDDFCYDPGERLGCRRKNNAMYGSTATQVYLYEQTEEDGNKYVIVGDDRSYRVTAYPRTDDGDDLTELKVPKCIKNALVDYSEYTYYASSADAFNKTNPITTLPPNNGVVYVRYTYNNHKNDVDLKGEMEYNMLLNSIPMKYQSNYSSNCDIGKGSYNENSGFVDAPEEVWTFTGNDPYGIQISNGAVSYHVTGVGSMDSHIEMISGTSNAVGALVMRNADTYLPNRFFLTAGKGGGYVMKAVYDNRGDYRYVLGWKQSTGTSTTDSYCRMWRSDRLRVAGDSVYFQLDLISKESSSITYHIIDKQNKEVTSAQTYSNALQVPASVRSPLVSTYHYWTADNFTITGEGSAATYTLKESQTEVSAVGGLTDIYVTYDVNNKIDLNSAVGDYRQTVETGSKTVGNVTQKTYTRDDSKYGKKYLLKFISGESIRGEDGADGVMPNLAKSVYPYACGDANLYIYGEQEWKDQLSKGSSTRTRWPWYLISPNNDPYHVKVVSNQNSHTRNDTIIAGNDTTINAVSYYSAFRTFYNTQNDAYHNNTPINKITTGVISNDPWATDPSKGGDPSNVASEYMLLGSGNTFRLVTTEKIYDGETTEHRTVDALEQYWKTWETIRMGYTAGMVNPDLDDDVYTYQAWAYARPDHAHKDPKRYAYETHYFQTVEMGENFTLEEVILAPVVVLIDNHGWEILRHPIPMSSDTQAEKETKMLYLNSYNSPMVEKYIWYNQASKMDGYHKYHLTGKEIPIYTKNSSNKWVEDTSKEKYVHTSTSLSDIPYDHLGTADGYDYDYPEANMTDLYVTYIVKEEYRNAYNSAENISAPFLFKQGDEYAKTDDGTTISTVDATTIPVDGTYLTPNGNTISTNMLWKVTRNADIDIEEGYLYKGEAGAEIQAQTKEQEELDYENLEDSLWHNGFDPYNIQLQAYNGDKYLTTTATDANTYVDGTIQALTAYTTAGLAAKQTEAFTFNNLGNKEAHVTNQTFMVIKDKDGNTRLFPRFDHARAVENFTSIGAWNSTDDGRITDLIPVGRYTIEVCDSMKTDPDRVVETREVWARAGHPIGEGATEYVPLPPDMVRGGCDYVGAFTEYNSSNNAYTNKITSYPVVSDLTGQNPTKIYVPFRIDGTNGSVIFVNSIEELNDSKWQFLMQGMESVALIYGKQTQDYGKAYEYGWRSEREDFLNDIEGLTPAEQSFVDNSSSKKGGFHFLERVAGMNVNGNTGEMTVTEGTDNVGTTYGRRYIQSKKITVPAYLMSPLNDFRRIAETYMDGTDTGFREGKWLWAFVGTPYKFEIVNREAGTGKRLAFVFNKEDSHGKKDYRMKLVETSELEGKHHYFTMTKFSIQKPDDEEALNSFALQIWDGDNDASNDSVVHRQIDRQGAGSADYNMESMAIILGADKVPANRDIAYCKSTSFMAYPWNWNEKKYQKVTVNIYPGTEQNHGELALTKTYERSDRAFIAGDVIDGTDGHYYLPIEAQADGSWKPDGVFKHTVPYDGHLINIPYELRRRYCKYTVKGGSYTVQADNSDNPTPQVIDIYYTIDTENAPLFVSESELSTFRGLDADATFKNGKKKRDYFYFLDQNWQLSKHLYTRSDNKGLSEATRFHATNDPKQLMWYFVGDPYNVRLFNVFTDLNSSEARNFVRHRYADQSHSTGYSEDQNNDNKTYMENEQNKKFYWELVDTWVGDPKTKGELDSTHVNVSFRKDLLIGKPFALRMKVSSSADPTAVISNATYYYLKDQGNTDGKFIYKNNNNSLEPRMNQLDAFANFPDSRHLANNISSTLTPLKPTKVKVTVFDPDEPTRKVTDDEVSEYFAVTDHFKGVPDNLQRKHCEYWWVSTGSDPKSTNMVDENLYYTVETENPHIYARYREDSESPFSKIVDGAPVLKRDESLSPWYNMNIGNWWAFFNSSLDGMTYAVNGTGANVFNNSDVWFVYKGSTLPNGTEKFRKGMQWALIGDPYNFTLMNNRDNMASSSLSSERRTSYLFDSNQIATEGTTWTWIRNGVKNTSGQYEYFLSESSGRRTEVVQNTSNSTNAPRRILPSDYTITPQENTRNITVTTPTTGNLGSSSITTGDNYAIGSNMYLLSVNDPKADNESFDAIVNVYNKLNELVATTGWTELARTNAEWSGSLPIDVRRWGCTYHYWADETMTRYPFHTYDQKDANGEYLVKDGGTVYVTYDYDESLYSSENEYRWVNLFFNWDDDHKEWTNDVVHDKEYTAEYWEYNTQTNKFEKRHEYDVMQTYNRWVQHDLYTDTQEGWIESPLESANNYDKNKAYAYNDEGQYADATDAKKQKWAMIGDPYKFILYNYNRKAEAGAKNSYYLRWDDKGNPLAGIQPGIGNYNYSAFPLGKENTPGLYWTWKVDGTRFTFAEGDAENNTTTYGPRAGLPESFYQDYEGAEASNDAAVKKAGYSIETGYLANCALQCKSLYDKNNLVGTVNGYVTYTHKSLRTTELTNGTGDEAPLTYHTGTRDKFHQYTKDPNNTNQNVNDQNIDYTNNSTVVIPGTHQDEQHPDVEETDDVTFTQQWRTVYGGNGYDNEGKYTSGTYEGYYVGPESSLSRDRYQEFTTYKNVQEYNITGDINSSTQYLTMKIEPSIEKIKADYEAGRANSVHIPRFLVMPMAAQAKSITFHLQTDKYSDGTNTKSLRSADNVIYDYTSENYGVGNTLTLPWMMRRQYCDYQFYLVAANAEDDNSNNLAAQIAANKIDDLTHVEGSASNTHRLTSQQRAASTYTNFWTSGTDLSQDANCYNSTQNEYVVPEAWADKDVFVLVKYKPTAEFESMRSTGSDDAKWLNIMNVENGNLMQYTRSNNVTGAGKDTLNNVTNDYLWAIDGDPYGFKLRNRYAVHGFDETANSDWSSLMTTGKVNTTENYNYLDGLDDQGSPKNLNFTYNTDGDPIIKSGITYGTKADADAAGIMSATETNAVFEAMTGNYDGAMLIHPVNACINIRNQNGYKFYGAFMFNGAPTGDPVQLNYMQDWEVMRNVYANWLLKKPAAKQFLSYYQNAGYVGGLKSTVAENETYSAIFAKIAAGTALTSEEYNTAWSLVYDPDNLVPFEDGYYRLRAYSANNGVVGGQYASGYLHKNELSSSTGTPLHLYEKEGVTTNYTTLESYDGNDWMADYVGKTSLEVLSPENDPSSIFYVTRDNNGYMKIQTQGLVLSGNMLVEEPDEPTDTLFFEVQDIGQTAFQMRSKTRAIAGTETTYLSCNPNTLKYGLNAASPELNVSEGVSDGQTVKTFDTMWMLQKVGTGTGEMPLNLKLNNGRDGYYYSTFCAPYDVVMPEGVKAFILADAPVANDGSGTTGTAEVVLLSNYTKDKYKDNFPEAYRELDNYIPANTPVVLRTEGTESLTNGAARITIPAIEPSTTAISENMLSASLLSEKLTNIGDDERVYVFGMVGNRVGFGANSSKNPETDAKDNSFTNHHKVYIIYDKTLSNGNSASGFTFLFNEDEFETGGGSQETDGVTQVETDDNNSVIDLEKEPVYDLQGRRVYPPFRRGIYIVRGKKFVIK